MRIFEKIAEIPITAGGTSNRITIPPLGYLTELRLHCRDLTITATGGGWTEDAGMHLFQRIEVLAGGSVIRSLTGRAAWHRHRLDHRHQAHYALSAYSSGGSFDIVIPIEFVTPRSFNPLATAVPVKWFGRDGVVLQVTFGPAANLSSGTTPAITASQVVEVVAIYEESLTVEPRHFRTQYESVHVCDTSAASQESISLDDRDGLRSIMLICTDAASDLTKDATMNNHSTWRLFGASMGESRKRIVESHYELVWRDTMLDAGLPEITHGGDLATPTVKHAHNGVLEHHFDPHGQLDALNVRSKMSGLDLETIGLNAAADKIWFTTEQIEVIPAMLNP